MKVMKFGGTSVGSPERMKTVASMIENADEPLFVVLSAMSGTTNTLIGITEQFGKKDTDAAVALISKLENKYIQHAEELYSTEEYKVKTKKFLNGEFSLLRKIGETALTLANEKIIVAQGEIISTNLFTNYLHENGCDAVLLSALDFMKIDENGEPDIDHIKDALTAVLKKNEGHKIYITQGFICRNNDNEIDNLKRGGSDYTASLIGAALLADEIQIWTDIDGMHNSDPRFVDKTEAIRQLNFEEAAELAYFGAKILHPTCVLPAKLAGIPVRLKDTMKPEAEGTIIDNVLIKGKIKAVAAKDNITAIKIKSSHMLLATGFMRKIFEIFETYHTPIDMITTSEVGVSMSIDDDTHLNKIVDELKKYGMVTVDTNMCIVCVVGDLDWSNLGFETTVLSAMKDIPVRMISYGGSNYNISFLIKEADKQRTLQSLSTVLFN